MNVGQARRRLMSMRNKHLDETQFLDAMNDLQREVLIEDAQFKGDAAHDYLVEVLSLAAAGGTFADVEATAAHVVRRLAGDG